MSELKRHPVPDTIKRHAHIDLAKYQQMYKQSIADADTFWADQANLFLTLDKGWNRVKNASLKSGVIKWFEGAKLNVSVNCIDRHLPQRGNQIALLWEGDDPTQNRKITYQELHDQVCKFANGLRARGVKKGDRVCIYMPMIPEAVYAMLACTRIGAIHSVVFGGFSPESIKDRILDSDCHTVITADEGIRGGKKIPLKANVDQALSKCPNVQQVIVVQRTGVKVAWNNARDIWYHELIAPQSSSCTPESMDAEDPLFILYTSGSTGKPKGVLHTTAGYLLYVAMTFKYVFDYQESEVFWCTADVGWITGHSYLVYGPLANGAISLVFEGIPTYPDASRFWQVVDKHQVNIFYTAPTALRSLMREGDGPVKQTSRKSLRILGTVGEPINPEAWEWYYQVVGDSRCPIVDTWWQTETGGHVLTPLPGAIDLKPGSATMPFFGIVAGIVDNQGKLLEGEAEGNLVLLDSWPGQMRTVYGNHQRFIETYLTTYPGMYVTGDGARRDKDGYYWITGRVDDVIKVSGHRIGSADVESALVLHDLVAEAAVVGYPHAIKGQGIYAFITLVKGAQVSDDLKKELAELVRREVGSIAKPDILQWASSLPKTRSGKIMRRILRKIAANDCDNLGDVSTLAEPSVVKDLVENRPSVSL